MGFVLDLSTNILIITNKTKEYIKAWFKQINLVGEQ